MVKFLAGDKRIDDLLLERAKELKTLSNAVSSSLPTSPLPDGVVVDDLFLLRYLLSYKTPEKAVDPVIQCMKWRQENQRLLTALAEGKKHPLAPRVQQFQVSGVSGTFGAGEPVAIVRLGMCDLRGLMNEFTLDEVAEYLLFEKEKVWRMCDQATRASGRLVKSVTIIDFADFSLFGSRSDNRFFKALGKSSKLSSLYYPQLQAKTVSINTPKYYNMIHKTISAVMPKSSMEKMVVCPAKRTSTKSASSCPFLKMYDGLNSVPDFLGGTGSCPRDLMAIRSEEGTTTGDILSTITIKPRSKAQVQLHIDLPNSIVQFQVAVEKKHIMLGADLLPEDAEGEPRLGAPSDSDDGVLESSLSRTLSRSASGASKTKIGSRLRNSIVRKTSRKFARSASSGGPEGSLSTSLSGVRLPDEIAEDVAEPAPRQDSRRWTLSPAMKPQAVRDSDGLLKGTWKVSRPGKFIVTFDNSFSILTSKKVSFKLNVVDPPTDKEEANWWREHWGEYLGFVTSGWEVEGEEEKTCVVM